ncbi:MFS transporter [Simkania negevensis]|uniref:Major facilitator superfamily (MFS) profile domain-containing protein n=1 Tax=Simkania negevensis (strain ATCC VR-1471 / DSM 27360 / Z) TaxID=331113 RepID=F8L5N6_SIMNZ|nr:MFS transporter [Simkania negevensis]CCB89915.1 hypothetical protein SNE_A20380 [Simkania negevensis Z]
MSLEDKTFYPHPKQRFALFVWFVSVLFIFFMLLVESSIWFFHSPLADKTLKQGFNYETIFDPFLLTVIFLQLPVACFIDEYGLRRTISLVMLVSALGMILLGLSNSTQVTWISLFIIGTGWTVTFASTLKMISNWFHFKHFALMVGWTSCIAFLSSSLAQFLNQFLLSHFKWTTISINYGLIGIIYSLFFFIILGHSTSGIKYDIYDDHQKAPFKEGVKLALKSKENWFIALFFGLVQGHRIPFLGLNIPILNAVYHIQFENGLKFNTYNLAAFVIGILFFCWISMYYKRRKTLMLTGTIIAAITFLLAFYFSPLPLVIVQGLYMISAFFSGAVFLAFVMIHEKNIPQVTATVTGLLIISMAFFHLITGWIIKIFVNLMNAENRGLLGLTVSELKILLIIFPLFTLLGLLFLSFTKETFGKQKIR